MTQLNPGEIKLTRKLPLFLLVVVDFALLNLAFFLVNYWKQGSFDVSTRCGKLLIAFYGIWLIVSLTHKKFRVEGYEHFLSGLWKVMRSGVYLTYFVALMVVFMGLYSFSRGQVFGTCGGFVAFESVLLALVYGLWKKNNGPGAQRSLPLKRPARISWRLAVVDFCLVGVSFFIVNFFKRDGLQILPDYEKLLLLIYGLWFVCSLSTRKFERLDYTNYYHAFWPWIKAVVLMTLALGLILFFFRFLYFSRTQAFAPMLLLMGFEMVVYRVYYFRRRQVRQEADIESGETVTGILKQEMLFIETDLEVLKQVFLLHVRELFRDKYLKNNRELFKLMDQSMDLEKILRAETDIRDSVDLPYHGVKQKRYKRLFFNLHKVNDVRYLNRYFLAVHDLLVPGGYFVGHAHTIHTHRTWMFQKFPRLIANGLYALYFVIHRVCPKLPWVKQVYFSVTGGRNRILSEAELLGRLCFCGFEIVGEANINERLCVVGRKVRTVSQVDSPSYGPLVGFNRLGAGNKPIRTYKLRTMHPYSEFLQDYVYERHGLQKGGKIQNDFRVTTWGKVLRRLWLDELPMLYNWVRGEVQIFGVRPLSPHYFSLYPKGLQELRGKVKPGLVPPFYADMPVTFDEICESERRYIEAYLKRPIRTQVRYFWKAFCNIVFKGARSH